MKNNQPVTQNEREMKEGSILVSRTNLKGILTYCNEDFIELSGFTEKELIGKNHNIVRHPDMPPAAFADLWKTVKSGRPWHGVVKNRCKNGDYYWVTANVIPIIQQGKVVEYMSVRTKPSRATINRAEELYRQMNSGEKLKRPGLFKRLGKRITDIHLSTKISLGIASAIIMQIVIDAVIAKGITWTHLGISLGVGAFSVMVLSLLVSRTFKKRLNEVSRKLRQMASGEYFDWVSIDSEDEIGQLQEAVRMAQTRLGFDVMDAREKAAKAKRIETALDCVATNVMIADSRLDIIYTNNALQKMFGEAEEDLKVDLPEFNANTLLGANIDVFHKNPAHQRGIVEHLKQPVTTTITVGSRTFRFTATPIIDQNKKRIGTVVEWVDRTEEVATEKEIETLVANARRGNLDTRIPLEGKSGFFHDLGEHLNSLMEINQSVVHELSRVLGAFSHGDLTQRITSDYEGAFREIKESANETGDKLTSVINEIHETSEQVSQNSQEIAQGNMDLSNRTEAQASSLETTASSMEEINGTVRNNAANSIEASNLASQTREQAEKGGEAVNLTISAMSEISTSSKKIADITNVIDEIAFQTNLLALNAAVEAAHAGDQGRGFAVVASEVRILAQRSAEAAKEIKELIDDSVQKVEDGSKLVDESGETLNEIIESVKKVSDIIHEMSSASNEQATGIDMINQSIIKIDEATQQNTALVEETAAASQSLGEQAKKLAELVAFFNTGNTYSAGSSSSSYQASSMTSRYETSPEPEPFVERRSAERPWNAPAAHGPETAAQVVDSNEAWEEF
jgi:methyl-accepting chemotaxis protein